MFSRVNAPKNHVIRDGVYGRHPGANSCNTDMQMMKIAELIQLFISQQVIHLTSINLSPVCYRLHGLGFAF